MTFRKVLLLVVCALSFPVLPVQGQELSRVLIQRGERYLAMGKYEAAIANYSKVIACCEGTPDGAEAHNDLGVTYMRMGRTRQAHAEYEKALEINGYPLARFNLAKALRQEYERTGDEAARVRAFKEFELFSQYLKRGEELPVVVSYQKEEIEAYVSEALESLGK
ncbi:MAG: tetratricopeptide repeat protein [Desulfovibrionaceae bacterium]